MVFDSNVELRKWSLMDSSPRQQTPSTHKTVICQIRAHKTVEAKTVKEITPGMHWPISLQRHISSTGLSDQGTQNCWSKNKVDIEITLGMHCPISLQHHISSTHLLDQGTKNCWSKNKVVKKITPGMHCPISLQHHISSTHLLDQGTQNCWSKNKVVEEITPGMHCPISLQHHISSTHLSDQGTQNCWSKNKVVEEITPGLHWPISLQHHISSKSGLAVISGAVPSRHFMPHIPSKDIYKMLVIHQDDPVPCIMRGTKRTVMIVTKIQLNPCSPLPALRSIYFN